MPGSRRALRLCLRLFFGGWKVVSITYEAITDYTDERLFQGAANATVNRELAALRRMLNLAVKARLARDVPPFDLLEERNTRKGKWTEAEVARVLKVSPDWLKPLIHVANLTGWRMGELLSRRWRHVSFMDGFIRLDADETKSGDPRNFPLYPELLAVLRARSGDGRQSSGRRARSSAHCSSMTTERGSRTSGEHGTRR